MTSPLTMFTYVCLGSNDLQRSASFYDPLLATLGLRRCRLEEEDDWDGWIGWGHYAKGGVEEVALWICTPQDGRPASVGNGTMVAFGAQSWEEVEAFHTAALKHGGRSEGAPALRVQYNPDFFACYVRDPDGNKLAAVCRGKTSR